MPQNLKDEYIGLSAQYRQLEALRLHQQSPGTDTRKHIDWRATGTSHWTVCINWTMHCCVGGGGSGHVLTDSARSVTDCCRSQLGCSMLV